MNKGTIHQGNITTLNGGVLNQSLEIHEANDKTEERNRQIHNYS